MFTDQVSESIRSALRTYPVGRVHEVVAVAGDHAHSPHIAATEAGRLFVKMLSPRYASPPLVEIRHAFVDHLTSRGLSVPCFIRTSSGEQVLREPGRVIEVQEYVLGSPLQAHDPAQAALAGKALADLHLAAAGFAASAGSSRGFSMFMDNERARVEQMERQMQAYLPSPEVAHSLSGLKEALVRVADSLTRGDLPLGMIHGELQRTDILYDEQGRLWVTDFDACRPGPMVWDLLLLRKAYGEAAVLAYFERRPLSASEEKWWQSSIVKEYLRYAIPTVW